MKVLIIEDEARAARQLQNILKRCGFEFELLGIIDSVEEAIPWFEAHEPPDLVFMDIQLADGLSFEIFQKTSVEAPIIFTTAFDQYAIQAFKVNSIDYLLKPVQQEDLSRALNKFNKASQPQFPDASLIKQLLSHMQAVQKREGILVREGNGYIQISIPDFLYFYSEDSITFGITGGKRYVIDETLDQLFNSLDHTRFYRINRGQVVAKAAVEKIAPYFNHRVKLSVTSPRDQEFIVSRQKTTDFKTWMNS